MYVVLDVFPARIQKFGRELCQVKGETLHSDHKVLDFGSGLVLEYSSAQYC